MYKTYTLDESYKFINPIDNYSYYTQVIEDIKPVVIDRFVGLSLQEIEEQYSLEDAQTVYAMACDGIDLTKPQPIEMNALKTRYNVKYRVKRDIDGGRLIITDHSEVNERELLRCAGLTEDGVILRRCFEQYIRSR